MSFRSRRRIVVVGNAEKHAGMERTMQCINEVRLLGNLGADPETRYSPGGKCVCNIRMATTVRWKNHDTGEWEDKTEWHRLVAFGRHGEVIGDRASKGDRLLVDGHLQTRKWQDANGQDRYTTEVVVDDFTFAGAKHGNQPASDNAPSSEGLDEDLPY